MGGPRPRLTAADIVARAVPRRLRQEYRRFGYVTDLTMSALTERAARQWPDRPALVQAERRLSYRELLALVERAAGWLAGIGAGPTDVVCWQTPNWWEAHVLGLAIWHLGAVSCPVVPFYREHELRQIIEQVRPSVVVTAGEYRGFAHAEAFDELLADAGLDVLRRGDLGPPAPGLHHGEGGRAVPGPVHLGHHLGGQGSGALLADAAGR